MAGFLRKGKMVKQIGKSTSLLRSVQERLLSIQEKKEGEKVKRLPYLGHDWMFHILLSLPVRTLIRLKCLCKAWLNMINSSAFIKAHMERSETLVISLRQTTTLKPNTFFAEANPEQFSIFRASLYVQYLYICMLEIRDCKSRITELNVCCSGDILASCNGLILVKRKQIKGGMLVMNPMTRKVYLLPLGTVVASRDESFGFMFSEPTSEYKVVHLFQDKLGYTGCEIFSFNARSWKAVDGPPCSGFFRNFSYKPIAAIGALHWFPDIEGSHYIVSMEIEDEQFVKIMLPKPTKTNDRLVEMRGSLSFVTHSKSNLIKVWILKDLRGTDWTLQYSIIEMDISHITHLVPIFTLGNGGKMVFHSKWNGSLYTYDFEYRAMKKVEAENEDFQYDSSYVPHINSLTTWVNA